MKKLLLSLTAVFIFAGLTYTYSTLIRTGAQEVPATPVTPPTSGGLSTGGVKAFTGGYSLQLDFNAHASPLMGNVNYKDTTGTNFKGKVDVCYSQTGNRAVFAGTVQKGSTSGQYFLVQVQDNGEGKNAPKDMLGVSLLNTVPDCTFNSSALNAVVTQGNLRVHQK